MIRNPVYQRELMRSIRAPRLILAVFFFNLILGLVGMTDMVILMNNAKSIETINYTMIIRSYEMLAAVDALMIFVMTPAQTAGSICYEREKNTFDILKVSGISGTGIVMGKLMAAMAVIMTLTVSTMPMLSLSFVFGGVRFLGLLVVMFTMWIHAIYIGSIGIAFSAWSKSIAHSMIWTYGVVTLLTAGTAVASYMFGIIESRVTEMVMLFNPVYTFMLVLSDQVGDVVFTERLFSFMGINRTAAGMVSYVHISIICQLIASALFIMVAVKGVSGKHKKHKK